ncbi:hypothetical protein ACHAWF_008490, partial [Thalassiosira exigua]
DEEPRRQSKIVGRSRSRPSARASTPRPHHFGTQTMIAAFGARRLVRPATSVRASIAAGAGAALAASAILSASVGARESDEAALAVRDRPHDAAADGSTSTAATATPSNSISSTTTTAARCACERAAASTSSSSGPGELRPPSRGGLLAQFRNRRSRRPPPPRRRPSAKFDLDASYALLEVLGEGAYGTVYRARRRCDGKEVALKAMPREFTGRGDFEREVAALRLLGEGTDSNGNGDGRDEGDEAPREAGRDRIVKLYDLHRDDENYYLSMELVEGGELFDHLVAGGPFSEGRAATFLRQFAEGLSYAHNAGELCDRPRLWSRSKGLVRGLRVASFGFCLSGCARWLLPCVCRQPTKFEDKSCFWT